MAQNQLSLDLYNSKSDETTTNSKLNQKQLLLDLYNASNGEAVHKIILKYALDGSNYWKPYGNNKNNAGTFENQQASPENALVEKLTNSIDAILMKECYYRGINPKGKNDPNVPQNLDAAIEKFFKVKNGKWENLTEQERNTAAQNIQIIVTDDKKRPNIAIYDSGEGQNPDDFPNTFLSIAHGNKNDIPFVQGKYNFGSTGAVAFCGEKYRYQMIISRRNESLKDGNNRIGFTLVRRHILNKQEEQEVKLTWYEYLVIDGKIPSIPAEPLDLGLFSKDNRPYTSGTIVKMYSYQLTRASDATLDLWRELNPLLFTAAIPVLIFEKRYTKGHSQTKLMLGNHTRLALDEQKEETNNIEFKKDFQLSLFESTIPVSVYIFKRNKKSSEFTGAKSVSVIYMLNGQAQGTEPRTFISQDIGFRNLRDYMLVSVDCSQINTTARQELFMASRDRLKDGSYYKELRGSLISILKADDDINDKDQEYKGKSFHETAGDRELVESMFSHLKSDKEIQKMFSQNKGAFEFFTKKTKTSVTSNKGKRDSEPEKKNLNRYPSIFRVKGLKESNTEYIKAIKRGSRGKILLETDVDNDFLSRSTDNGSLVITTLDYGNNSGKGKMHTLPSVPNTKLNVQAAGPYNGEIKVYIEPKKEAEIGETIPLSIKMISSAGEHEVIVYVRIDKEAEQHHSQQKNTEEPNLSLPRMVRVFKNPTNEEELSWEKCDMSAETIVKLIIGSTGAIEEICINMDSNLVKRLANRKNFNASRVQNKYLANIYDLRSCLNGIYHNVWLLFARRY